MFLLHSVPVVVKIVIPVLPASAPLYIFRTGEKGRCIKGGDENVMELPLWLTAGHLPHNEEIILSNTR